jgi:hypothetical protein
MSDIVEVLGSKKFSGSKNETLKTRLILEQPGKIRDEYNLFTNISQDDQFVKEKNENEKYKVYGTISPVISKKAYYRNTKLNIDKKVLDFTPDNWSIVLCKPVKHVNQKGKKEYVITYTDENKKDLSYTLDLSKGLPASLIIPTLKTGPQNASFLMNYGHNFNIGDQVYIRSKDDRLKDGVYFITNVDGKNISIDFKISARVLYQEAAATKGEILNVLTASPATALVTQQTNTNQFTGTIRGVQTTNNDNELINILKAERPTPYRLFSANFSISKVIDNEVLEYYVKQAEVVQVLNTFDQCGFSKNLYDESLYNFYFEDDFNIGGLLDNKDEPITECYLGVIKNGATSEKIFSTVESNFEPLIDYTNPGEGIKKIASVSTTTVSDKPDIKNIFDIGIYEYSAENLTEELISPVHHNFIHNYVLFKYVPFKKIDLKLKSTYIEDSVSNSFIPKYAVYSRKTDKYIWRDVLDLGVSDDNGVVLDYPFLNGSRYLYDRFIFNVLTEKNKTKKYKLNVNDISNIDSLNSVDNYTRNIVDDLFGDNNDNKLDDPFKTYTDEKC